MKNDYLFAGVFLAAIETGCVCQFKVEKLVVNSNNEHAVVWEEIPLEPHAPSEIPIYWESPSPTSFNPPKATIPQLEYKLVGKVHGVASFFWQRDGFSIIEDNFRRAAHSLNGDAVINARRGAFVGWYPANEFYADIVRWEIGNLIKKNNNTGSP